MSNQKLSPCKESVKECVLKRPMTFMKLVSETQCASETVEKYLSEFLNDTTIKQKKGKFRIIYSPELDNEILEFYELLLNPTIKAIVIVLLKSTTELSQIELVSITEKSNPSISRGLKLLLEKRIIKRNYHAPYSTYNLNDKEDVLKKIHKTYPNIYKNFNEFELCYPQPKIFLDIHQ
jgi:predicted transcriptional regulator